jgi:excisionase family DNA binding protein
MQEKLLTIEEVSEYLNIKKRTLYKYVQENYIPHVRINKKVIRFQIAKIDNWLETLKNNYKA